MLELINLLFYFLIQNFHCFLLNLYLEKDKNKKAENNENSELKNKIINLLTQAFNDEIKKIKILFEKDKNLWKSSYDSLLKAYEQYVKSIEKK